MNVRTWKSMGKWLLVYLSKVLLAEKKITHHDAINYPIKPSSPSLQREPPSADVTDGQQCGRDHPTVHHIYTSLSQKSWLNKSMRTWGTTPEQCRQAELARGSQQYRVQGHILCADSTHLHNIQSQVSPFQDEVFEGFCSENRGKDYAGNSEIPQNPHAPYRLIDEIHVISLKKPSK